MLIKKTQCHENVSVRKPPRVGPIMDERPKTADKKPWYFPRSEGGKRSPMTVKALAIIIPAPIPWSPRHSTIWVMVWLRPHSSDPTVKMLIPIIYSDLRPYMSVSLPAIGTVIVEAIR